MSLFCKVVFPEVLSYNLKKLSEQLDVNVEDGDVKEPEIIKLALKQSI